MLLIKDTPFFTQTNKDKNSYLLIEANVVNSLLGYRQRDPNKLESGGCLMGFYRENHIHITALTTPQPNDHQTKYSFIRRDSNHSKLISNFMEGNRHGSYIGEWHSHPQEKASPSIIDINEWNKIVETRAPTKSCFIVLGNDKSHFEIL